MKSEKPNFKRKNETLTDGQSKKFIVPPSSWYTPEFFEMLKKVIFVSFPQRNSKINSYDEKIHLDNQPLAKILEFPLNKK